MLAETGLVGRARRLGLVLPGGWLPSRPEGLMIKRILAFVVTGVLATGVAALAADAPKN